jgi:hypothetical protein
LASRYFLTRVESSEEWAVCGIERHSSIAIRTANNVRKRRVEITGIMRSYSESWQPVGE